MQDPYTMDRITVLAKEYADARKELEAVSAGIRETRRKAVRNSLPVLKRRIARVSAAKDELRAAIEASPHLFEKPRTVAIDGVKIGYRKLPGKFVVADEKKSIELARKRLPKFADALIRRTERLIAAAMKELSAGDLAKIGVRLEADSDEVVISAASDQLDKLVDALMQDAGDDA